MRHRGQLAILVFGLGLALAAPAAAEDEAAAGLDLPGAVRLALAHQPSLAAAGDRARAAGREADARSSQLWPQLGVQAGDLYTGNRDGTLDFAAANGPREITGQLVVGQWLLNRTARETVTASRAAAASSRMAALVARLGVAGAVARTFFALMEERAAVDTWRAAEQMAGTSLQATQKGLDAGTRSRLDLVRASTAVTQARQGLAVARAREEAAAEQLGLLTGLAPLPPLAPPPPPAATFTLPSLDTLDTDALAHQPSLALRRSEAERQTAMLGAVRGERLPRIQLQAAVGWDTLAVPWDVGPGWSAGVFLAVPVFTSGALRATEDAARLRAAAAETDVRQARLDLRQALAQARGEADAALADVRAAREIVPARAEIARISNEGYEAGRLNSLDLFLAQQELVQARLSLASATARLGLALARIDLLTGRLPSGGG